MLDDLLNCNHFYLIVKITIRLQEQYSKFCPVCQWTSANIWFRFRKNFYTNGTYIKNLRTNSTLFLNLKKRGWGLCAFLRFGPEAGDGGAAALAPMLSS